MTPLMLLAALSSTLSHAASVDLAFAVQPDGPSQTWTVEVMYETEYTTRVPGSDDWELRVTMDETAGQVAVDVGLYEVIRSPSGRERYRLATQQQLTTQNDRSVAMLYRPPADLHWMRKQKSMGMRPSGVYVEVTPRA